MYRTTLSHSFILKYFTLYCIIYALCVKYVVVFVNLIDDQNVVESNTIDGELRQHELLFTSFNWLFNTITMLLLI